MSYILENKLHKYKVDDRNVLMVVVVTYLPIHVHSPLREPRTPVNKGEGVRE